MVGLKDALRPLVTGALHQLGGVARSVKRRVTGVLKGPSGLVIEARALYAPPARTSKDERNSRLESRPRGTTRMITKRGTVGATSQAPTRPGGAGRAGTRSRCRC